MSRREWAVVIALLIGVVICFALIGPADPNGVVR